MRPATPEMKAIQQANSTLINYGRETVLEADEPAFSNNANYLFETMIRLMSGSVDKAPYALGRMARILRILSYAVRWVAAFAPVGRDQPKVRQVYRWLGQVFLAMLATGVVGWMIGTHHDVAGTLSVILYGVIAVLSLVALGCVLGYRWGFATTIALVAGLCIGSGITVYASPILHDSTVAIGSWDVPWLHVIPAVGALLIGILALLASTLAKVRPIR